MSNQYLPGVIAFVVCAGTLPIVKWAAEHLNLYDLPGPLKIHNSSIARLGGISMMVGILAGVLAFRDRDLKTFAIPLMVLIAVWAVGLIDDVISLPSYARFFVHVAAGATLWFAGWQPGWFHASILDLAATCFFVALVINSMNLLDGMDGLAAGVAAVVSSGFIMISMEGADSVETLVASSLLGVCAGVLTANAPPATIFMGDSGSTLIGISLAFLSLQWIHTSPTEHSVVIPLIFLAIPLADVVLAVLRRATSHAALFEGDRRHFYDIARSRGWSVSRILRVSLGITGALVITGGLCARGILGSRLIAGFVVVSISAVAYFLGSLQPESEHDRSIQSSRPFDSDPITRATLLPRLGDEDVHL